MSGEGGGDGEVDEDDECVFVKERSEGHLRSKVNQCPYSRVDVFS